MKAPIHKLFLALAMFAGIHQANAAVTFTVTPFAISNTYTGPIMLQVAGLTGGDTVVVQKYFDANTNGVVDAPDYLVQQFRLTDGQAGMVIGGVTNISVPGDTDTTAGQITAKWNFPDRNFVQNFIGKFLLVFSSPAGHFTPITNSFSVTNFPFGQKITGTVFSNTTPVPNAVVIIFPPSNGHDLGTPVAGTVANNSGIFAVQLPPGTYVPLAVKSNYLGNYSKSPIITLGSGQTITTNLTVTNATASISGKMVDANNSSIGLPGIFLPAKGTNSAGDHLIAVGFTDTNGNFTTRVGGGMWNISGDVSGSLNILGYVGYDGSTNIAAGATGIVLPFYKATALFYGTVKDNLGNPLPGVAVFASDNNSIYSSDGISDVNGNYATTALGGLGGATWGINEDNGGPANYIYSQGQYGITLSSGQAYHYNFTGVLATNHIAGNVQYNGANVVGVQVYASANIGGNYYQSQADTDGSGNYSLIAANGNWTVTIYDCGCSDSDSLNNVLNGQNYQDPSSQSATVANNNQTVNFTIPTSGGGGSGQIYGYVTDTSFNPIAGIDVYADDGFGDSYQATTDGNGYYSMNNVVNSSYDVYPDCGQLNSDGYSCPNDDFVNVSGNSVEADFSVEPIQIYGFVIDAYGNPVTGVNVYASDGLGDNYTNTTDGYGYYSMFVVDSTYDVSLDCGQLSSLGYQCASAYYGAYVSDDSVEVDFFNVQFITTPTYPFTPLDEFSTGGGNPYGAFGGLLLSGNILYGTTTYGGTNGFGEVFTVNINGTGFTNLYNFSNFAPPDYFTNSDGNEPYAGLILSGGTLYGTTESAGPNGAGTVFSVNTNGTGFTNIHSFKAISAPHYTNSDGANPYAGLILSGMTLYGTAYSGGTNGNGTVFALTTNGSYSIVHTFTVLNQTYYTNNDGANPAGSLILSGNTLYGTAEYGGTNGWGTVFKINTNGTGFTTLYNFTGGDDGDSPTAGLLLSSNILYGTTSQDGYWAGGYYAFGTIFAVGTNGAGFTVLHTFTGGDDGDGPNGLILSGNTLYGTATFGGSAGNGTVFAINVNGSNFIVLHAFTAVDPTSYTNSDGANPVGSLILSGNTLYGKTTAGASTGNGTVFAVSIIPSASAPVISSPALPSQGRFQMIVNGSAGQNYTVQMNTNLISTNWMPLLITNPSSSSFLFNDPNATNPTRFYRILIGP